MKLAHISVRPIKIHYTFPPWAERNEPLVVPEMDGLEIAELHSDQPLPTFDPFRFEFEIVDGKAENYPYLKICCVSEAIMRLGEHLWLKTSVHIPML